MTEPPAVLPEDAHNRTLLSHVGPPDWVNPDPAGRYNLVVIGAGTAGLISAAGAAGLGAKTALIEKHLMGETASTWGASPQRPCSGPPMPMRMSTTPAISASASRRALASTFRPSWNG